MKNVTISLEFAKSMFNFLPEDFKGYSSEDVKAFKEAIEAAEEPMISIEEFAATLQRPFVILDCETTGTNTAKDKIVQLSLLKICFDGTVEEYKWNINPEMAIPEGASKVHGITNEMVANEFTFCQIKDDILEVLNGSDIGHFNGDKFDVPLLCEEFYRCGVSWPAKGTASIDVSNIFRKKEGRSLGDAVKFYLQGELVNAHDAAVDTEGTLKVLLAQLKRYGLLGKPLPELAAEFVYDPNKIDIAGKFAKNDQGEIIYTFGKNTTGQRVKDNPSFAEWMIQADFTAETKRHAKRILEDLNYM